MPRRAESAETLRWQSLREFMQVGRRPSGPRRMAVTHNPLRPRSKCGPSSGKLLAKIREAPLYSRRLEFLQMSLRAAIP